LGDDWLAADRESIGLRAGFWLDVTEFQQHLADDITDGQRLSAAVDLYRDDFLTGFTLPDCPDFDEWQYFQSESLRQSLASTLEKLAISLREQADYETAIGLVNRHEYGNGVAIFTRDGDAARDFARRIDVGMVGVNVPIPVPVAYHSDGKRRSRARRKPPRHSRQPVPVTRW